MAMTVYVTFFQPMSKDDTFWGVVILISGHPAGHEQSSHQSHLKVDFVLDEDDGDAMGLDGEGGELMTMIIFQAWN